MKPQETAVRPESASPWMQRLSAGRKRWRKVQAVTPLVAARLRRSTWAVRTSSEFGYSLEESPNGERVQGPGQTGVGAQFTCVALLGPDFVGG
jgi:hypothetical protein